MILYSVWETAVLTWGEMRKTWFHSV